jgi:hypothetical protein
MVSEGGRMTPHDFAVVALYLIAGLTVFAVAPFVWSWLTMKPVEQFWTKQYETEEVSQSNTHYNRDLTYADYDDQQAAERCV